MLGLAGSIGVEVGPPVGCARFEFILPLPMAAGMAVAGAEVSVSVWAARAVLVPVGKSVHPTLSVVMRGDNYGSPG